MDFSPGAESDETRTDVNGNLDTTQAPTIQSTVCDSNGSTQDPSDPRQLYGDSFVSDTSRPLPARFLLSGSLDATVKLWDTATGQCLRTWFGHSEGIWGLQGDNLRVLTGGQDGLVKVWEPRSGACVHTFTGHTGPVTCVGLTVERMASGSEDGEVRLYSFQ